MDYQREYLKLLHEHLELKNKYDAKCKEYNILFNAIIKQRRKLKSKIRRSI
jgi:hypothetical protein